MSKLRQHRRSVDGHVEDAIAGGGEVGLGEVQQHRVLSARRQARDGVGEDPGARVLIDRHRRGIGAGLGEVDRGRGDLRCRRRR